MIARAGLASRRQAEQLIRDGEVSVNGRVVTELGTRADPARDHVKVGRRLLPKERRLEYFAFNKPVGVITTMSDPEGRPCVGNLVRRIGKAVHPVGRLDFHSSGLLLLTNDGDLTDRLTHPRYHVEKAYRVKVGRVPGDRAIERLRKGVRLDDGVTAPAFVRVTRKDQGKAWLEVRITEGRNRQVRRMLEAVGLMVEKLRRTSIGPIKLGRLAGGDVRRLEGDEVAALLDAVGLDRNAR